MFARYSGRSRYILIHQAVCEGNTSCLYICCVSRVRSYGQLEMMIGLNKITGNFFQTSEVNAGGMDSKFLSDLSSHSHITIHITCKNVRFDEN